MRALLMGALGGICSIIGVGGIGVAIIIWLRHKFPD